VGCMAALNLIPPLAGFRAKSSLLNYAVFPLTFVFRSPA
jgi:hypothetical protein